MARREKLLLQGLRLYGRHGVHKAEKVLGQQFKIDLEIHANLKNACKTDDFNKTLDYVKAFNVARDVVQGPAHNLVEHVAHRIAQGVLTELPAAEAVLVRVAKPHVALPATLESVGVEIYREREES